jgi:hypothetical protein
LINRDDVGEDLAPRRGYLVRGAVLADLFHPLFPLVAQWRPGSPAARDDEPHRRPSEYIEEPDQQLRLLVPTGNITDAPIHRGATGNITDAPIERGASGCHSRNTMAS